MGKKLAIKGHPTRGKEVIELLEMLGGSNIHNLSGNDSYSYYIIKGFKNEIRDELYIFGNEGIHFFTIEEFWRKYPYKVGDIVKTGKDEEGVIKQMRWVDNDIVYWVNSHKTCDWTQTLSVDVLDKNNRLNLNDKVNENDMESCKCPEYEDIKKVAYLSINVKDYADEIEVNLGNDYEYKFEMNRLYILKKKPRYPKLRNLTECKEILGEKDIYQSVSGYKGELLTNFQLLLIFRDAYWKIAGEEMGLDKPWEPDWSSFSDGSYPTITKCNDRIIKTSIYTHDCILAFPTQELRDIFYDNFKELIENCKELL